MVIAGQDTGIRWTHSALQNHYRGWNGSTADNNYNWHDAIHSGGGTCGANSMDPGLAHASRHGIHSERNTKPARGGARMLSPTAILARADG